MTTEKVQWRIKGLFKADAQTVYGEIQSIGEQVTAEQILDKARDCETELHKCFEWDDSVAGEKYRLIQARRIVTQLYVMPKSKDVQPVRVLSHTSEHKTYQPTRLFVRNEVEYDDLLKRALNELQMFKQKYAKLVELEKIIEDIDFLIES